MAEFNPKDGDEIWIDDYWGPKCAVYRMQWPDNGKVLAEFHGSPTIVDTKQCFTDRRACYLSAAARKHAEASAAFKAAGELLATANEEVANG